MQRQPSLNNHVTGHRIGHVSKFSRGRSWNGGTLHGTVYRCECGWEFRSNEGPPSKTTARQNEAYRRHVPELGPPTPPPPYVPINEFDPKVDRLPGVPGPGMYEYEQAYFKTSEALDEARRTIENLTRSIEFQTQRGH